MRRLWIGLVALGAVLLPQRASVAADPCPSAPCVIAYAHNRIAIDVDGNFNDPDDWAATPVMLALIARLGLQSRLVHYDYNNSLGANGTSHGGRDAAERARWRAANSASAHRGSSIAQSALSAAIANLQAQVNASSATDPLFVIAAGPMEVLWRSLSASDPEREAVCDGHLPFALERQPRGAAGHDAYGDGREGPWGELDRDRRPERPRSTRARTMRPGPTSTQASTMGPGNGSRMRSDARMRWIYDRMLEERKPDISDAGNGLFPSAQRRLWHARQASPVLRRLGHASE